jgi:hypothetical protein
MLMPPGAMVRRRASGFLQRWAEAKMPHLQTQLKPGVPAVGHNDASLASAIFGQTLCGCRQTEQ